MRRFIVLTILLLTMLGVQELRGSIGDASNSLTLAAIGFVVLVSFTVAEVGSTLTLPRVTGYIVTGALLSSFDVLSAGVINDLKMFNTLALGLIALGAGLELDVSRFTNVLRTLAFTILGKLLVVPPLVGVTFYFLESQLHLLGLQSQSQIQAMSLALGTLALGTSPAIALAVISESQAKGRLADLVLGSAVVKDFLVIVTLALALTMGRSLLHPAATSSNTISHVFLELGASVLVGGVLGLLLIAYLRYVKAEMLLFVAAMILVVSELSHAFHLELLLVFITSGFIVRNFSTFGKELLHPVEMVSLPVFVVFFTIAGATIDPGATLHVLPLAFALALTRGVGFYAAARFGNHFGGETEVVQRNAALGYLPQAGVTLGLVGVAARALPELAANIVSTGTAAIALNLLVGPITLRFALRRAGEITTSTEPRASSAPESQRNSGDLGEKLQSIPTAVRTPLVELQDKLQRLTEDWVTQRSTLWVDQQRAQLLDAARPPTEGIDDIARALRTFSLDEAQIAEHGQACLELYFNVRSHTRALPDAIVVPLEPFNRNPLPGDKFGIRWSKRLGKFGRWLSFQRSPQRIVPLKEAARAEFEPRAAETAVWLWSSEARFRAHLYEDLALTTGGRLTPNEFYKRVDERFETHLETIRCELLAVAERAITDLIPVITKVDTVYLRRSQVRASSVEGRIRLALRKLDERKSFSQLESAYHARILANFQLQQLGQMTNAALHRELIEPGRAAATRVYEVIDELIRDFRELDTKVAEMNARSAAEYLQAFQALDEVFRTTQSQRLEQAVARFRGALSIHGVAHEVRAGLMSLPEAIIIDSSRTPPTEASTPNQVSLRRVELRALASRAIDDQALSKMDSALELTIKNPTLTSRAIFAVLERARMDLRAYEDELDLELVRRQLRGSLRTAIEQLVFARASLEGALLAAFKFLTESFRERLELTQARLGAEGPSLGKFVKRGGLREILYNLKEITAISVRRGHDMLATAGRILGELTASELSQDVWVKYGTVELDTIEVKEYLDRHRISPALQDYAKFFDGSPVREPSRFIVRKKELRTLLDAEQGFLKGEPGSALVVGESGSGKTSLLNLCQNASTSARVLRPEPIEWRRDIGIIQALSFELGTRPRVGAIARALSGRPALILIDDLEEWLPVGPRAVIELEMLLDLIIRTKREAFWLVSIRKSAYDLLSSLTHVDAAFARIVELDELNREAIAEVIEARNAESNTQINYPETLLSPLLRRFRGLRDRDLFYGVLTRAAGGNLGRTIGLWLRVVEPTESGHLKTHIGRALSVGLPFFRQLTGEQVACLVLLTRTGPLRVSELSLALALSPAAVTRELHFLVSSGLIERRQSEQELLQVASLWLPLVSRGLKETHAQ